MRRFFIALFAVATVVIAAVAFSDRKGSIVPQPSRETFASKIADKTQVSDTDPQFSWSGLGVLNTPLGPCGIVQRFGDRYATREHLDGDQLVVFDTLDEAKSYVLDNCQEWYWQKKAARDANSALYSKADPAVLKKLHVDVRQPLFTKAGAMACPTWQGVLYTSTARDRNWKYPGGLIGIDDPVRDATHELPAIDSPVSAETWSCKIYSAGLPVTLVDGEQSPSGNEVLTNLGWSYS